MKPEVTIGVGARDRPYGGLARHEISHPKKPPANRPMPRPANARVKHNLPAEPVSLPATPDGPPPIELTGERRKLWDDVRSRWHLEPASENLLRNAAESLERAAQYAELVRQEGGVFRDRFGGVKPHPAAMLERDFRGLAARQLQQLAARMEGGAS